MTAIAAISGVTIRALLSRRRALLVGLLAALPILLALLIRLVGGSPDTGSLVDALVIRLALPIIALVIGTGAVGSEVDDGTFVFTLVKPVARWRIALAKVGVAVGLTVLFVAPCTLVAAVLLSSLSGEGVAVPIGFAVAAAAGGAAYAGAFTALGTITSRALIIGLAYTLIWEGLLSGLLQGTRFLSIREATAGVASFLTGEDVGNDPLEPVVSAAILLVVIVGSYLITVRALARFQVRSAD